MSHTLPRGRPIYLTNLHLVNFRNYRSLDLELRPGMVLIQGDNGQGKSNLLEAIYILAIAKSSRASSERDLIHQGVAPEEAYAQVSATVRQGSEDLRLRMDYQAVQPAGDNSVKAGGAAESTAVRKGIRVNGVPRRASDLVGQMTAVMFSADDLELVYGSPSTRRRYLDILISQLDREYLRTLQRYQRVVYQRNHLLRMVRQGRSNTNELGFWDDELVREGSYIVAARSRAVRTLSDLAGPVHRELSGGTEQLDTVYLPSFDIAVNGLPEAVSEAFRASIEARRDRELVQGATLSGPHRDDLRIRIDSMEAGAFASRGQSRTAVLAMRLAEAAHLAEQRGSGPIVLLDDVLSELDAVRRAQVLDRAETYEQCFITATDLEHIEERFLSRMAIMRIDDAGIRPMTVSGSTG